MIIRNISLIQFKSSSAKGVAQIKCYFSDIGAQEYVQKHMLWVIIGIAYQGDSNEYPQSMYRC